MFTKQHYSVMLVTGSGPRELFSDEPTDAERLATIFPHCQELVVKHAHRVHKRFPFRISEPLVDPLLPLPRGRI